MILSRKSSHRSTRKLGLSKSLSQRRKLINSKFNAFRRSMSKLPPLPRRSSRLTKRNFVKESGLKTKTSKSKAKSSKSKSSKSKAKAQTKASAFLYPPTFSLLAKKAGVTKSAVDKAWSKRIGKKKRPVRNVAYNNNAMNELAERLGKTIEPFEPGQPRHHLAGIAE